MTSTGTADSVTVRGRARVPMAVMPPRMIASSARVTSRRVSEPAVTATSCRTMAYPMRWTSTVWVPTGTPSTSKDPSLPLRDPMESAAMRTCAPARPWLVAPSRTVPAMAPWAWACPAAGNVANSNKIVAMHPKRVQFPVGFMRCLLLSVMRRFSKVKSARDRASVSAFKCDGHDVKRALSFVHGQYILAKVTRASATLAAVHIGSLSRPSEGASA